MKKAHLLTFLLLSCLPLQAAHYKLFILTGQSNSLGTTNGSESDLSPGTDPADTHVPFYWHNVADASTSLGDSGGVFTTLQSQQGGYYADSSTHWGPEINFARTLYRAGVSDFAVIKASRGGGGNTHWSKANAGHMYDHVVDTVTDATNALTTSGDTFEIVGLLYLQGESDSVAEADIAGTRLKELTDNLRTDLPNAASLHAVIGGIANGTNNATVRARHESIATSTAYIDYFPNLDLQSDVTNGLHFDKAAKLRIGERFAQAFFSAGTVTRHYGKLVFIGDSITQGGNGFPSYRYTVFSHLANQGVPINPLTGYQFTGSVTGAQANNAGATPDVNGQTFENNHDGHYGWRASWINARVRLPANRRDNNRGEGTLLNWTNQASPQTYLISGPDLAVPYPDPTASGTGNTGTTYTPDTAVVMIGINDLGDDNNSANQVIADIGTLVDQLRAANPNVRIHLNHLLHTNQTQAMRDAVDAANAQLQALADTKNAASSSSPVWVIDANTGFNPVAMTYDNVHPNSIGETHVGDRIAAAIGLLETPEENPPPHLESISQDFPSTFEGHEIWDGTNFVNSWTQFSTLTKSLPAPTDLRVIHPSTGGRWIEGTNTGWTTANTGDWTFEARLKFDANANGFILWLGTGSKLILVEIHGDRTQDGSDGGSSFNVAHNNLDGNFHSFRVAHDAAAGKYHVWRDGVRLSPLDGADYDQSTTESRMILGDYTSGNFGDFFDVTIDHVRYDQSGAFLPPGADADSDGMPDAWEYLHFGTLTGAVAGDDSDGDGRSNVEEFADGTDPHDQLSFLNPLNIFILTGQSNSLGTLGTTDDTMRFSPVGSHPAEQAGGVPFFWDNRADGTPAGDAALGDSGGAWVDLGTQTGGYYAGNDDHWGPEIGFARMLWNAGYRDFAIVKASRGGGGNTFWEKNSADDHMYDHLVDTVNAAVATLPADYSSHQLAGLLYVQGESNDPAEAAAAGTRFSDLIDNLKADLAQSSTLHGVFGEIAGTGGDRDTTRSNQLALANSRSDIGYAESTALTLQNQDGLNVHYNAESQILLGERMAAECIAQGSLVTKPLPAWPNLHAWFVADNGMTFDGGNAVDRWATLHDGRAIRDLSRRVAGQTFRRNVTAGNGQARQVMRFDGSNDLWSNATTEFGSISGARSVALLCRVTTAADGFLFDGSTGSGRTRVQIRTDSWQAGTSPNGGSWDIAENDTVSRLTSTWQQHVFNFLPNGGGGTTVDHWIDGSLVASVTDPDSSNLGGLIVGSCGGSPFSRLASDIAEIAVYDTTLDNAQIAALSSAWDARWGNITGPPFAATVSQSPREIARFGLHELLELQIDSDLGSVTTLNQVRVQLAPGTRSAIVRASVISTNSGATLANIDSPTGDELVFSFSAPLAEGDNRFRIVVEPARHAALGTLLDASVTDVTFSGSQAGTIVPSNNDPAGELTLALVPLFTDVRTSGEGGVHTYRIPGIATGENGVLHAVYDHRHDHSGDLPANVDVGYSRSTDGGATWSPSQIIMDYDASEPGSLGNGVGDPTILFDPVTDTLWVAALWSFGNNGYNGSGAGTDPSQTGQYVLTKSEDGGDSWSAPINITVAVKDDPNWRLIFQGPGHGLAMRDGTLVFPSQYRDASGTVRVCSIFSTDHGLTWDFGSGVPVSSPQTNENTVCELDDGRLLFSMRTPSGSNGQRAWIHYTPGGATPMRDGSWSPLFRLPSVPDPVCQGSVIQWTSTHRGDPNEYILFGNPNSSSSREDFTLRISPDGGDSWPVSRLLYGGPSAYSSLCILPDRSIGILFEKDNYTKITFARVEEAWLFDPSIDADNDGMPDAWETLNGLNPAVDDAGLDLDGDGISNLDEYKAGTDPRQRDSNFRVSDISAAAGIQLQWSSVPGRSYAIEESSDLDDWQTLDGYEALIATGPSTSISVPDGGSPARFFRIRVLP